MAGTILFFFVNKSRLVGLCKRRHAPFLPIFFLYNPQLIFQDDQTEGEKAGCYYDTNVVGFDMDKVGVTVKAAKFPAGAIVLRNVYAPMGRYIMNP